MLRRLERGALETALVHDALGAGGRAALLVVLPALLALADALVRRRGAAGAAPAARALGRALYARAFVEVADAGQRQEIVGQLVAHAGSGVEHEVAAALGVLRTLALERRRGAGGLACIFNEHVIPLAVGRDAADAEFGDERAALRDLWEGRVVVALAG